MDGWVQTDHLYRPLQSESIPTTLPFPHFVNSLIFALINLHTIPHSDKVKNVAIYTKLNTEISHLHKYSDPSLNTFSSTFGSEYSRAFLSMTLQAWHGEFLPFFSNSISLKLCQIGWGEVLPRCSQVSQEMFDRIQVRTLARPLKDIQRHVPKPLVILDV